MRRFVLLAFVLLLFTTIVSPSAQGSLLTLSTHASNDGPAIDPNLLDATLDFSVLDSTLTLTVFNMTPENTGDPELKINEIYFNASDKVTDLVLFDIGGQSPTAAKWAGTFNKDNILVNNFGKFDVSIINGGGNSPQVIGPGETLTFKFNITAGSGSYSDTDFIALSTQVNEHIQSYAAAKFYNGVDISGHGATNVPEPGTICLLGLGGLLLRRRKSA